MIVSDDESQPEVDWDRYNTKEPKIALEGLNPGTSYVFKLRLHTEDQMSEFSDAIPFSTIGKFAQTFVPYN